MKYGQIGSILTHTKDTSSQTVGEGHEGNAYHWVESRVVRNVRFRDGLKAFLENRHYSLPGGSLANERMTPVGTSHAIALSTLPFWYHGIRPGAHRTD
jgi:hypothetical protein